jgi:RNA polymerase primary sigma factor
LIKKLIKSGKRNAIWQTENRKTKNPSKKNPKMRQLKISTQITSRDSLALDKYLSEIGKIELLSPAQEILLAQKIRQGDEEALNKMTLANLRFVISVAKQYQHQGLHLADLINEGNVGLIKAAQRFDETKGFKFISYAVWWIRQTILQSIVENARLVRLPLNKVNLHNKVSKAHERFMQHFEREPSAEELSDNLSLNQKDVENVVRNSLHHLSMDAEMGGANGEEGMTLLDTLLSNEESPENELINESLQNEVKRGMETLHPREKEVLCAFYGLNGQMPISLEEIGYRYNLTRERVRQIRERALRRMRKSTSKEELRGYLG